MEHLVHDFPFTTDFEQGEQIRESTTVPILEFETHRRNRFDDVDAGNSPL